LTPWNYQLIESMLDEIWANAGTLRAKLSEADCTQVPARLWLQDVDQMFNALRKIKALLVRDRKSKA
jgi:hypothetical protein